MRYSHPRKFVELTVIGPEAKKKRGKERSKKGKEAKGEQGGRFHFFVTVPGGLLGASSRADSPVSPYRRCHLSIENRIRAMSVCCSENIEKRATAGRALQ
jgi:hypothetical protein